MNSIIESVGSFLPPEVVNSDQMFEDVGLERRYGIPNDWMSKTMGIVERRFSKTGTQPSELASNAAKLAIERSDINPSDIGMVVFCGIEKDQSEPATAHNVNRDLGLNARFVFDTTNACFGFMDGIEIADAYLQLGRVKAALVVTGETQSSLIGSILRQLEANVSVEKARDFLGFLSLGDAGGAVLMTKNESTDDKGFKFFENRVNSNHLDKCFYRVCHDGEYEGQMKMSKIVAHGFRMQTNLVKQTLRDVGWKKFDWLLTHQTGKRNFEQTADLGVAKRERMVKTYDTLGNITSATLPVTLDKLFSSNSIKKGQNIGGCFGGSGLIVGQFGYTV